MIPYVGETLSGYSRVFTQFLQNHDLIKNERQYRIAKKQVARFSQTLGHLGQQPAEAEDVHPLIAKARKGALRSRVADLEGQLREYESLKAGRFEQDALKAVAELPFVLIKARITQGLRQKDLAERLSLKEQQTHRYEGDRLRDCKPNAEQGDRKRLGCGSEPIRSSHGLPPIAP